MVLWNIQCLWAGILTGYRDELSHIKIKWFLNRLQKINMAGGKKNEDENFNLGGCSCGMFKYWKHCFRGKG